MWERCWRRRQRGRKTLGLIFSTPSELLKMNTPCVIWGFDTKPALSVLKLPRKRDQTWERVWCLTKATVAGGAGGCRVTAGNLRRVRLCSLAVLTPLSVEMERLMEEVVCLSSRMMSAAGQTPLHKQPHPVTLPDTVQLKMVVNYVFLTNRFWMVRFCSTFRTPSEFRPLRSTMFPKSERAV